MELRATSPFAYRWVGGLPFIPTKFVCFKEETTGEEKDHPPKRQ